MMPRALERQQSVVGTPIPRIAKDSIRRDNLIEPPGRIRIAGIQIRVVRPYGVTECILEGFSVVARTNTEQRRGTKSLPATAATIGSHSCTAKFCREIRRIAGLGQRHQPAIAPWAVPLLAEFCTNPFGGKTSRFTSR
jgi:hypothetical protein